MDEQPTLYPADERARFLDYCRRVAQDDARNSARAKFHVKQLLSVLREGTHDHN